MSDKQKYARDGGYVFVATSDPSSPIVQKFYHGYQKAFTLANESETEDAFVKCLTLNGGKNYPALAARYGAFREYLAVLHDAGAAGQPVIGGANFICLPQEGGGTHGSLTTVHLNYVYVVPEKRGQGFLHRMIAEVRRTAAAYAVEQGQVNPNILIFLEQNDPLAMSAADGETDLYVSGIAPADRIFAWGRMGAKIIDFPYVQPPLSSEKQAEPALVLAVIGLDAAALPAATLYGHLRKFFAISVLKGHAPETQTDAAQQLLKLQPMMRDSETLPVYEVDQSIYRRIVEMQSVHGASLNLRDALRGGRLS